MFRKRLPISLFATTSNSASERSLGIAQGRAASPLLSATVQRSRRRGLLTGLTLLSPTVLIWVATLAGFWLRTFRLDFQPLWFDEGYSLYFANNDFLTTATLTAADIHPPFYYDLLHLWMTFGGSTDISVRLFSVFTGTLSIPLIYVLAKKLFDQKLAVLSALLLSFSPMHIYYAQEVRMYSLFALEILLCLWLFASVAGIGEADKATGSRAGKELPLWILFVILESLAFHTQYYAIFVPVAQLVFLLLRRRRYPKLLANWFLAQVIVLLTFLPWMVYAGLQLVSYVGTKVAYENYAPMGFSDFFWRFFMAFSEGTEHAELWQWVAIPVFVLAAFGATSWLLEGKAHSDQAEEEDQTSSTRKPATSARQPKAVTTGTRPATLARQSRLPSIPEGILLCLLLLAISGLGGWLVNQRLPFNPPRWERLYLFSLPFFILLVALGLRWLASLRPTLGQLGFIFCLLISILPLYTFYTVERYPNDDYRPLVKAVNAIGRPDDLVAVVYPWQIGFFESYYRGPLPKFVIMYGEYWNEPNYRAARLIALSRTYSRIWVPAYQALGGIFERQVETFMANNYFPAINDWYGNTRLLLFHTGQPPEITPDLVDFGSKVRLLNYGLDTSKVEAGNGSIDAILFWRAEEQLSGKLVVKLRLYDDAGHTWAQRDSEPAAGLKPLESWTLWDTTDDRHALLVPAGTPPGDYNLGLSLTLDGKSLDIIEPDGNPHGQELMLGKIQVSRPASAPRVESLPIRTRLSKEMGDGIRLVGYSMSDEVMKPGETLLVNAFWQAQDAPQTDHEAVFRFVDGKGNVVGEQRKAVGQSLPTSRWVAGEVVRDQFDISVPPSIASGTYEVRVSFDDSRSFVALDQLRVEARDHVYTQPPVSHSLAGQFADSISLVGFDIGGAALSPSEGDTLGKIRAGNSYTLKLVWRADKEITQNLKVFNQALDSNSRIWGQRDSIPGQGAMPTTGWAQGEYLEDSYEITLKPDTLPGTVELIVGFYDPGSGARLPAIDASGQPAGDRLSLGKIEVEP